jgi:predicted secreted protein
VSHAKLANEIKPHIPPIVIIGIKNSSPACEAGANKNSKETGKKRIPKYRRAAAGAHSSIISRANKARFNMAS